MRRDAGCDPPRRARPVADAGGAAGRAGAEPRRRGRQPRLRRGRAVRAGAPCLAVPRPAARRLRCGAGHAGRGLCEPLRDARRVGAPGRGQPPAARAQGRAPGGDPMRRHDPRRRRLHRVAGAAGGVDRHRQRRFRDREPGGRHLPARQCQLSHPQDRARQVAGRGCAGRAAVDPVLAGRSARAQRRAVACGLAPARGTAAAAGAGRGCCRSLAA